MIYIIIYTVGAILSYIICRIQLKRESIKLNTKYGWDDIFITIFAGLISWLGVMMSLIFLLSSKESPKWL